MTDPQANNAGAWSNYWRKGFLTTFVDIEEEGYSGLVKEHWNTEFSDLGDRSTIADLGAGNGAILALAKNYLQEHDGSFELIAVDYADIGGGRFYTEHPDIDVRGNTSIEATGLENECVDLCVSQFGFEYSDTSKAAAEVARILKSSGRFSGLMHHTSSPVTLRARSALEQIGLCERSKLTETTTSLIKRLRKLAKSHQDPVSDGKAAALRDQFNKMAQRLNQYADRLPDADHVTYFLNELANLFGKRAAELSVDQKLEIIRQLEADSEHYRLRMQSMVDSSSDAEQIDHLKSSFEGHGMVVRSCTEMTHDGVTFAWNFSAEKP